jgi:ATP synthase subunit 6
MTLMRLFQILLRTPRFYVILALLALPTWASAKLVPHHGGDNPFVVLYMHLIPSRLESPGRGHAATSHEGAGTSGQEHAGATGESASQKPGESMPSGAHGEQGGNPSYLLSISVPVHMFFDMDPGQPGTQLVLTNLQLFQIAAVLLVMVCFAGVPRYLRTGRGDYISRLFAGFALWVRDEMIVPVMGRELGRKFTPYFLSLFFFLVFMNVLGLLPGAATATASIFVTGALATLTLFSMIGGGMVAQGPIAFWKNLVPHVPLALWPLMFVVELIGLMVKPFALTIRLFANMTGGHMVVLSFMGLIFFFAQMSPAVGYASAPIAVAFAVFIMIIECFVALLQAYIFTMLSIIFVTTSIHPEH